MTTLAVRAEHYKLKYNENDNKLRDLTWEELKIAYGKGSKIICPCMDRQYNVIPSFIAQHMKSQKHRNWLDIEQKLYNKECGHCGNSEDIINTLYKQLRENKIMYHNLNCSKNICDAKLEKTEKENNKLEKVIELLNNNIMSKTIDNKILLTEIEFLEENLKKLAISLEIKLLEKKIQETQSNIFIKKRKSKKL
jgi:hypothetical protein